MDPGFTLYLINGHPLADYPLLYNGSSNFVDLSDIPVGMVDHIDILPGNQSSIYGSSAIAGVINIILKDHIDGYELNVRGGGYTGGGGSNERVEFLGGNQWGDLSVNVWSAVQQPKADLGLRPCTDGIDIGGSESGRALRLTQFPCICITTARSTRTTWIRVKTRCKSLSNLEGGTIDYEYRPGLGNYCGSKYTRGYSTMLNQNRARHRLREFQIQAQRFRRTLR